MSTINVVDFSAARKKKEEQENKPPQLESNADSQKKQLSLLGYLANGFVEYLTDLGQVAYISVDAECPGVIVPRQYVNNGKICLNLDVNAVTNLKINSTCIEFSARFNTSKFDVYIPSEAIEVIYARDNPQIQLSLTKST